jgi:hypothetical protein
MSNLFIPILACNLIILAIIILQFINPQGETYPGLRITTYPKTFTTSEDINILRNVCLEKVALIRKKTTIFTPYNHHNLSVCEKAIKTANSIQQLALISLILPHRNVGLYPIRPLQTKPLLFQYEQGENGWYWGYATFPDTYSSVMYYIIRIELGTQSIREKIGNLPLGSTTVYSISLGVGIKGKWVYTPESIICPGSMTARGESSFSFQSNTTTTSITLETIQNNGLHLIFNSQDSGGTQFGADITFTGQSELQYNAKMGCAPCLGGEGTLYLSYPQMGAFGNLFISNTKQTVQNGNGWMDHQWLSSGIAHTRIIQLLSNISRIGKVNTPLGRYAWITIHTDTGKQYMIVAKPPQDQEIKTGLVWTTTVNIYTSGEDPIYRKPGTLSVLETITIQQSGGGNVIFPNKIKVTAEGITYILDSTPYGNSITIDPTGNIHWSSSATLTGEDGKSKGTGFLEYNQFQDADTYRNKTVTIAGIDPSMWSTKDIDFIQVLPSILYLCIIPAIIIGIIAIFIHGIRKQSRLNR